MNIRLYNTLSKKVEEFAPLEPNKLRFYHCGPTVYWTQHIGNLRGLTMGDLIVRTFKYFGFETNHVRNYTDVGHLTGDTIGLADQGEDRMEKGAKREGLSPDAIAQKYIDQFEADTKAINLLEPDFKPRATQYVKQMIAMVKTLIDKGFAYETDLAVYFEVEKFPDYTKLSKQKLEKIIKDAGKGEISDPQKKNPADFALWFFKTGVHKNALQTWPSPFHSKQVESGIGFPGWHIECSAMSKALLGETLDLHMGGIEHIPIHHTNEITQSEATNGKKFVNYWLHNEHLLVENKKMAKSEGTAYSLQEVVDKGFEPMSLRYFFLTAHYRSKQNFTWEALKNAQAGLQEMREKIANLKAPTKPQKTKSEGSEKEKTEFGKALAEDFNLPKALAIAWKVLKDNRFSDDEKKSLLLDFDRVLGLKLDEIAPKQELKNVPENIKLLLEQREKARKEKNFAKSDEFRKKIESLGFEIQDSSQGQKVYKKRTLQ
ncbi:MAG: Cysteine-tRNA ligase [Parcubacteria group bacterium GW2011_GWC1_45_9]|nr:MAG: Cysteine-tRNA ligase [Parcubacteria group bacterium GW2011_GWA1_Parcubacteria_45_10]KKT88500.1 MAG: Cysteine-tRNA ligase [Parcubacteria group bacterium GW2011_GWB1_45_10]KKU17261.1 MAG: Cysteine-tRNA ligase [Parcubacteria group bacterium GW2011_GWC1_45_9]